MISFVVPCFRSRGTLPATLDSILGQSTSRPFEVVVVESSGDGTAEWVRERYPSVRVLASSERLFPGVARNRGAARAGGDWLAFVDADAVLRPDWLEAVLEEVESVGAGAGGGWVGNANPGPPWSRVLHWVEFSEYLPAGSRSSRALSSSNLLVRREDFLEAGGFDPEWRMAEDLLFCLRFAPGIRFCGRTGILHRHRGGREDVLRHLRQLGFWSGRVRRAGVGAGAWLRRAPAAGWLLLPWRWARIVLRVFRSGFGQGCRCLADTPRLLAALRAWLAGFQAGLTGREGPP